MAPQIETSQRDLGMLYKAHAPEALRIAFLLMGSADDAEDLVHDAFVRMVGKWAHLRNPSSFGAYLNKSVVNGARMKWRRRKLEAGYLQRVAGDKRTEASHPSQEDAAVLREGLLQLPYRQRAALVLRFYADMPDEQIAGVLGCARGTVRSLAARGLESLRSTIGAGEK